MEWDGVSTLSTTNHPGTWCGVDISLCVNTASVYLLTGPHQHDVGRFSQAYPNHACTHSLRCGRLIDRREARILVLVGVLYRLNNVCECLIHCVSVQDVVERVRAERAIEKGTGGGYTRIGTCVLSCEYIHDARLDNDDDR